MNSIINEIISQISIQTGANIYIPNMNSSTESLDSIEQSPYQSEIIFNRLLPYADQIDTEADNLLANIKANFGRCVIIRDINPGAVYWSQMLTRYITLYGLRFTKDEHIVFIKLSYELLIIPNLQSSLLNIFGKLLILLFKKKEVIAPSELELKWEPLYKLCLTIYKRSLSAYSLYRYHASLEKTLDFLVNRAKIYFPPNATKEILDEIRPMLCPLDVKTACLAIKLLQWFLPVQLPVENQAMGHKLWFHELMKLWEVCHNSHYGESNLMKLMAKLASHNIGYIDWSPYIHLMFTRFIRSLHLPVNYKKIEFKSNYNIDVSAIGEWIASILGDKFNGQMYLEKFLKTIESYFHPANTGSWLPRLEDLFVKITYFVIARLHRERYSKKTWEAPIPENYKLTEANIDAFVNSMMPVAMTGVFNRHCSQNFFFALQYLSLIRPNLVIPNVLEKLYPSLYTNIESHKLITVMVSMASIARPLVQGSRYIDKDYAYLDGPSNVLPLLFSSLPGIDPNDPKKCYESLRLIATYTALIPIVDCSNSKSEKSENELALCEDTSRFEDFILVFMDCIFVLIESSSLEFVRMENISNEGERNPLEKMAEHTIYGVLTSVLLQSSDSIFAAALNKLSSFIMNNTLETKVAGQLVAIVCKVFCHVNSQVTLRVLLPFLTDKILENIDDIIKEDILDDQFLYFLLLLQDIMTPQGDTLLPYMETILKVLDKVLLLKSYEGHQLGCKMLKNVLESLCNAHVIKLNKNLDDPEYPYWRDWGESVDIDSAEFKWYVPGEQEMVAAQNIFSKYFIPAVESIQNYITTNNSLIRDELQATLRIISSVIEGCEYVLPMWSEPPLVSEKFVNCTTTFIPIKGNEHELKMPDKSNVRQYMVQIMSNLQKLLLQNVEDDTKSLISLIKIWQILSMNKVKENFYLTARQKQFYMWKKTVENKLLRKKDYVQELLLERVSIQDNLRKVSAVYPFTQTTKEIIENVFKLSTSQYSRIRLRAQSILNGIVTYYPNAYQTLIPLIVEILEKDTEVHHDAYKGVLYVIGIGRDNSLLTIGDWEVLSNLLPALVLAKPSEKPSIIQKQANIIANIIKNYATANITLDIPNTCIYVASDLWKIGIQPTFSLPSEDEIYKGFNNLRIVGLNNKHLYYGILDKLLCVILKENLHWRYRQMAMQFISVLVHPNQKLPSNIVRYFVNSLIHDSIDERKLAWTVTMQILKQLKKKHIKVLIEIKNRDMVFQPGRRSDNEFLQYTCENHPITAEQWDEPRYIHKQYIGYYVWPKRIEVPAPASHQPKFNMEQLSESEKEINNFFNDEHNISKLINFLTLEEKKGKDKFNITRYLIFKGLFRNYGSVHLSKFLPYLKNMVENKQESVQRCAAEIICGLVRGSKHWSFEETQNMWDDLLPIVKLSLSNLTEETINDWIDCYSIILKNRDPNRLHWLVECLFHEIEHAQSEVSFIESARLQILRHSVGFNAWRMSEMLNKLLNFVENRLLENPFENVRDCLAVTLVWIFNTNIKFQPSGNKGYPEIDVFVNKMYPCLENLLTEKNLKSLEAVKSTRLLITVCRWIKNSVAMSHFAGISSFFKLYPIISQYENTEIEEELSRTCTSTLGILAHTFTLPEHIPAALQAIENVSKSTYWSVRANCLQFLQVFLFHNMNTLLSNENWIDIVRNIILELIKDDRVEVRENSAQILNGMIHCTLISDRQALLDNFSKIARTKLKKKESSNGDSNNAICLRHAGVLGMCAFIQAHPYDIPKDIPPIFERLNLHLNDPEPIPSTIRKTLNDFKRTHCDGWTGLQGLAQILTEEQYSILQDLTMESSYYA